MAAVERETVNPVPWWKEPTKDQWYAWWAAWLGWTLDAFDFTVFLLIMVPISQEFGVPLSEVGGLRLACRPGGPQAPADDLDPGVFGVQLHRRVLADTDVSGRLPHRAWCVHGRGMARRRGPGDGELADPVPRVHEWGSAGILGDRLRVVGGVLGPPL